jgi:hypothetical protein
MTTQDFSSIDDMAPLFTPFEWVDRKDQTNTGSYFLLSNIRDLASGTAVALEIVERSRLHAEAGDAPIVDEATALRLTRMSIAAMNLIEESVDVRFRKMQQDADEQRKSGKGTAK